MNAEHLFTACANFDFHRATHAVTYFGFPAERRGRRNGSTLPLPLVHHSYIGVLNFEVTF